MFCAIGCRAVLVLVLVREPLAELLPRRLSETAPFAAVLIGTAPAFTSGTAERLLGRRPKRSRHTELPEVA